MPETPRYQIEVRPGYSLTSGPFVQVWIDGKKILELPAEAVEKAAGDLFQKIVKHIHELVKNQRFAAGYGAPLGIPIADADKIFFESWPDGERDSIDAVEVESIQRTTMCKATKEMRPDSRVSPIPLFRIVDRGGYTYLASEVSVRWRAK